MYEYSVKSEAISANDLLAFHSPAAKLPIPDDVQVLMQNLQLGLAFPDLSLESITLPTLARRRLALVSRLLGPPGFSLPDQIFYLLRDLADAPPQGHGDEGRRMSDGPVRTHGHRVQPGQQERDQRSRRSGLGWWGRVGNVEQGAVVEEVDKGDEHVG
jgi:hypothetical protein